MLLHASLNNAILKANNNWPMQVTTVTTQPRHGIQNQSNNQSAYSQSSFPYYILGLSVFTCLCCLWPVGLVALIMSIVVSAMQFYAWFLSLYNQLIVMVKEAPILNTQVLGFVFIVSCNQTVSYWKSYEGHMKGSEPVRAKLRNITLHPLNYT